MPPPTVRGTKTCSARALHHVGHCLAGLHCGGNIQKDNVVGPGVGVVLSSATRIARVPDIQEINPLDHPAVPHVQAGYDTFC